MLSFDSPEKLIDAKLDIFCEESNSTKYSFFGKFYVAMNIKRYIDRTLANGRGSQLIFVSVIIAVAFFSLWLLSTLLFGGDSFGWQDIIALFLDPGVFGGAGEHDWFRLIVTLVGVVLVAAMLISVFSNIFENISASYTKGEIRYKLKNQVLIIGANENLLGLLEYIRNAEADKPHKIKLCRRQKTKKFGKSQIIVMTTRPIEALRDEVEAFFNDSRFTNRIIFYFDRRDNLENLKRAGVVRSSYIYVLGEDGEENHDIISLTCVKYIRDILKSKKCSEDVECLAIMNSQTTMKAYQKYLSLDNEQNHYKISYTENIININECKAEFALSKTFVDDVKNFAVNDTKDINIVILGMSSLGRALATTLSYACHFKNKRHTTITIIDEGIENKVNEFKSRYHTLFRHNSAEYSKDPSIEPDTTCDLSWNFLDAPVSSAEVVKKIEKLQKESHLFVYVCHEDLRKNLAIEVALRNQLNDLKVFSDFGRYDDAFTIYLQPSEQDESHVDSFKGIYAGASIAEQYKYIFGSRQEDAQKRFEDAHPGITWESLTFTDKIRRVYESVVDDWWGRDCNLVECTNQILYLAVYGPNKFFNCADLLKGGYFGFLEAKKKLIKLLDNDIEADLSTFLNEVEVLIDESSDYVEVVSENLLNAILRFTERKDLSIDSVLCLVSIVERYPEYGQGEGLYYCELANKTRDIASKIIDQMATRDSQALMWSSILKARESDNSVDDYILPLQQAYKDKSWVLKHTAYSLLYAEELLKQYDKIKDDRLLDLIIYKRSERFYVKNSFAEFDKEVELCEAYIKNVTHIENMGDLYVRISQTKDLDNGLKGMWLIKAAIFYFNCRDTMNLEGVLYRLGDYFGSIDGKQNISKDYFSWSERLSTIFDSDLLVDDGYDADIDINDGDEPINDLYQIVNTSQDYFIHSISLAELEQGENCVFKNKDYTQEVYFYAGREWILIDERSNSHLFSLPGLKIIHSDYDIDNREDVDSNLKRQCSINEGWKYFYPDIPCPSNISYIDNSFDDSFGELDWP